MEEHTHKILKQVFELGFRSREKSFALQEKISRLQRNRLEKVINEVFDRLQIKEGILRFQRLDVNLGTIHWDDLESEMPEKLRDALIKALPAAVNMSEFIPSSGEEWVPEKRSNLQIIEYFLLTGALPWWAASRGTVDVVSLMEKLLRSESIAVREMILRIGKRATVRRRIVYQLGEAIVLRIIRLLEPTEATFIIEYAYDLHELQEKKRVLPVRNSDFKASVWEFILNYLINDRGSFFNTKAFVKGTLAQIAARYRLDLDQVLSYFREAVNQLETEFRFRTSLPGLIEEVSVEHFRDGGWKRAADKEVELVAEEQQELGLALWRYFLEYGSLPWWARDIQAAEDMEQLFMSLLSEEAAQVQVELKVLGRREEVRTRIIDNFSESLLRKLVAVLEPEHAVFILAFSDDLQRQHEQEPVVNTSQEEFRKVKWGLILAYLLVDRGSVFNTRMFVVSVLKGIAAKYQVDYLELLTHLELAIQTVEKDLVSGTALPLLLQIIQLEARQEKSRPHAKREQSAIERSGAGEELAGAELSARIKELGRELLKTSISPLSLDHFLKALEQLLKQPGQARELAFSKAIAGLAGAGGMDEFLLLENFEYFLDQWERLELPEQQVKKAEQLAEKELKKLREKQADLVELTRESESLDKEALTTTSVQRADLDVLEFFLRYGALPWWGSARWRDVEPSSLLRILLEQDPAEVSYRLLQLAYDPVIRKRISLQMDEALIRELVLIWNTDNREEIQALGELIPLIATAPTEFSIWNLMMEVSVREQLERSGLQSLVQRFLLLVGMKWKIVPGNMLDQILEVQPTPTQKALVDKVKAWDGFRESLMAQYRHLLVIEQQRKIENEGVRPGQSEVSEETSSQEISIPEEILFLKEYLLTGKRETDRLSALPKDLDSIWISWIKEHPEEWAAWLGKKESIERFQNIFSEETIAFMVDQQVKQAPLILTDIRDEMTMILLNWLTSRGKTSAEAQALIDSWMLELFVAIRPGVDQEQSLLEKLLVIAARELKIDRKEVLAGWLVALKTEALNMRSNLPLVILKIRLPGETKAAGELLSEKEKDPSVVSGIANEDIKPIQADEEPKPLEAEEWPGKQKTASLGDDERLAQEELSTAIEESNQEFNEGEEGEGTQEKTDTEFSEEEQKRLRAEKDRLIIEQALAGEGAQEVSGEKALAPSAGNDLEDFEDSDLEEELEELEDLLAEEEEDDRAIFIGNAGIVLLRPYLPHYFERVGLMERLKWKSKKASYRGAHLLQYLATGDSVFPEHHLVLNKLLCGLKTARPLETGIEYTDLELEVSESLLEAVISSWSALGNTSINGFRSSFLKREGKLLEKENHWELKVEEESFDILMNKLPWTIGQIKYSWMDKILQVFWR